MMRYLIFCGSDYYPVGGWGDYCGSADTLPEAELLLREAPGGRNRHWGQIVDVGRTSGFVRHYRWVLDLDQNQTHLELDRKSPARPGDFVLPSGDMQQFCRDALADSNTDAGVKAELLAASWQALDLPSFPPGRRCEFVCHCPPCLESRAHPIVPTVELSWKHTRHQAGEAIEVWYGTCAGCGTVYCLAVGLAASAATKGRG